MGTPSHDALARRAHSDGVRVVGRSPDGDWLAWRVGRMRLAWRPVPRPRRPYPGLAAVRAAQVVEMSSWAGSVLATPAALLRRLRTGRWPVVAYVVLPVDGDVRQRCTPPIPRAEADYLVGRWAEEIRRHGEPQYPAQPW